MDIVEFELKFEMKPFRILRQAAHKSDITFLSSTVTVVLLVVLLTFEALVVALVADVVLATYPSRQVGNKPKGNRARSYRASLGQVEVRQSSTLTHTSVDSHLPKAQHRSGVARACCVDNRGGGNLEKKVLHLTMRITKDDVQHRRAQAK